MKKKGEKSNMQKCMKKMKCLSAYNYDVGHIQGTIYEY